MFTAAYDSIAPEYYDASHKTSRNFDHTTRDALRGVRNRIASEGLVLDIGAGRGRCNEFLGVEPCRVIQLDNSRGMLELQEREQSFLRVLHRAEALPFLTDQFCCVTSFLCDPFLGLSMLSEAHRVLVSGGLLIATTPSYEWGAPLRQHLGLNSSVTRFITRDGKILVPSVLVSRERLAEMLRYVGFLPQSIQITSHRLPRDANPISADIALSAEQLGCGVFDLDILYSVVAKK